MLFFINFYFIKEFRKKYAYFYYYYKNIKQQKKVFST